MNYRFLTPLITLLILGTVIVLAPLFVLKVIAFFLITGLLIRFFIYRQIRRFTNAIRNRSNTKYYNAKTGYSYNKYGKHNVQTIEIEAKEI